jgi:hypothetical protein
MRGADSLLFIESPAHSIQGGNFSMSTNDSSTSGPNPGERAESNAAEAVRQAFSALPFEQKISTLIRIEVDILGDIADTVVSTMSKTVDEFARAFDSARASSGQKTTDNQAPTS